MLWHEVNDTIVIPLPEAFNIDANLRYLSRDKNECMYEVEDKVIRSVVNTGEVRFLVQISIDDNHQMIIQFIGESNPTEKWQQQDVANYICEWFDLERDLTPFYKMAKADPLLRKPAEKLFGLRVIGVPNLFEALCWGILGQQINLAFAYSLKRQFVEKFGDYLTWNSKKYWIFPTYERIAKLTPSDLADIKMTTRKSEYIIGIATLMANGELSKDRLKNMNFNDAERTLMNIRGIGPWTANYVLMRCLRFRKAFPIDDVGLINSIKKLRYMDRKPTKDEILQMAIPWNSWESYATFYLWCVHY